MSSLKKIIYDIYSLVLWPESATSGLGLPVIGVPVTVGKLKCLDALLSIVQMSKVDLVATESIGSTAHVDLVAVRMLSIDNDELQKKLQKHRGKGRGA